MASMGYLHTLDCKNDSRHPPLIPDIDNPNLSVRCVVPDCGYYKELGLQEQKTLEAKMAIVEQLIEKRVYDAM